VHILTVNYMLIVAYVDQCYVDEQIVAYVGGCTVIKKLKVVFNVDLP